MANIFKNLFTNIKKFSGYTDIVIEKTEQYVHSHHLTEFQKILSPFDTDIPMHVVRKDNGNDIIFLVEPVPGIFAARVNSLPDPGEIETARLFYILNDGSNNRHAQMPSGYQRESSPHSLNTSSQANDREAILVSKKYHYSIEPRDWLNLVEQKYRDGLEQAHTVSTKEFLKHLVKR